MSANNASDILTVVLLAFCLAGKNHAHPISHKVHHTHTRKKKKTAIHARRAETN